MRASSSLAGLGAVPFVTISVALALLCGSSAGCGAETVSPAVAKVTTPKSFVMTAPALPAFRSIVLAGRHAMQSAVLGPSGRIYVATTEELFVFSPASPSEGDRFAFHGRLAATPDGSRLYRTEGRDLFELDASGTDLHKVTFGAEIASVTFSPSGALLGVAISEPPTKTTAVLLRAADLHEVARLPSAGYGRSELLFSPDDGYVVAGTHVVDLKTGATAYEHGGLDAASVLFEGGRLYWLFQDVLEIVDLDKRTSKQAWLPCKGDGRADPEHHRFVTRCASEAIFTTVVNGSPVFTPQPASAFADLAPRSVHHTRVPTDPRFPANGLAGVAIEGANMTLRDGEIVVPEKEAPAKAKARVRIGPAIGAPAGVPNVEVRGSHIVVRERGGGTLADIDFKEYAPSAESVSVVGEKVVVVRRGWNPTEPPRDPFVCSFAGTCTATPLRDGETLLAVLGDEIVARADQVSGPALVRTNIRTGARANVAIPVAVNAIVRSEDGSFFVAMAAAGARAKTTLVHIDARTSNVTSRVDVDDPSYRSARLLGVMGERIVLTPDFGNWADVVLLDARTFAEKERYVLGEGSMLHVLDDGSFETSGDAAPLVNLVLCTDGKRFGPAARCAQGPR